MNKKNIGIIIKLNKMKNKNLKIKKSRRSFLKKTSTIAGGLIAAPLSLEGMANVYGLSLIHI